MYSHRFREASILILVLALTNAVSGLKAQSIIELPFHWVKQEIILKVFIKGEGPYNMMLDTGVTPSGIRMDIARELDLDIDSSNLRTISGRGDDVYYIAPTKIEDVELSGHQFGIVDAMASEGILELLGERLGIELHGILGYSFLKNLILTIDYPESTIFIYESSELLMESISEEAISADFVFDEGDIMPIVEGVFRLNEKAFTPSIDTGSNLTVEIFSHHATHFNLKVDTSKVSMATGAQGNFRLIQVPVEKLQVGDLIYNDLNGDLAETSNKDQLRVGNIGNGFLKNFRLSLDYPKKRIIFDPAE